MQRKLLRKPRGTRAEEALAAELEAQKQRDEAQGEEEQDFVRFKTQTQEDDRKRKRTAQDELLDKAEGGCGQKKVKNLKRKLQLQRKKQQRELNSNDGAI